ncbi:type II toxin-antitoxin system mRNA interferase toxin, RelE/StbE family, partial [Pseudomonas mosselii]|nr:type II toxin-antitoxin system mRNA interferase toxin, RelE/StbE family [Pseudomonas mosselii]
MTYRLEFLPSALKEWEKLGHTVREQARKTLRQRLLSPKVGVDALRDLPNHYKI